MHYGVGAAAAAVAAVAVAAAAGVQKQRGYCCQQLLQDESQMPSGFHPAAAVGAGLLSLLTTVQDVHSYGLKNIRTTYCIHPPAFAASGRSSNRWLRFEMAATKNTSKNSSGQVTLCCSSCGSFQS
jgi:hypothetical protein